MDTKLRRDVRFLKLYAACSTAAFAVLALAAFRQPKAANTKFEEIDVERINVVEKDGKLRLVISNRERSPGPIAYGKPFGYAGGSGTCTRRCSAEADCPAGFECKKLELVRAHEHEKISADATKEILHFCMKR